jgi:hypothetical protein
MIDSTPLYEKMGYIKIGEIVHSDVLTLWQYKKQMTKG